MKIKYTNKTNLYANITINDVYDVIEENNYYYFIKNDIGEICKYKKYYFEIVDTIKFNDYKNEWLDFDEEYHENIDCLYKYCIDNNIKLPKYAYACEFKKFTLTVDNILECEAEDHYENIIEDLICVSELYDFIENWNNKQTAESIYSTNTLVELDWNNIKK